ncbi:hypothetical protein LCGC14_2332390 [marine sediment metagenome]|uniref:Radical SAM core domain-containing protein n=1 Tax=marine sediment metagenome TaxID=412755 RepID=A0A0F9D204_9ZZZZ
MKIARLIVTFDCERNCSYCCNKYKSIVGNRTKIKSLKEVKYYDAVCITGGEPMLNPYKVYGIIQILKKQNPKVIIYLYSALWVRDMVDMMAVVNGIHFTLHANSTAIDILNFYEFQKEAQNFPWVSFRLYVHPQIKYGVNVVPKVWKRIESKPWIGEESCQLPENETLFELI